MMDIKKRYTLRKLSSLLKTEISEGVNKIQDITDSENSGISEEELQELINTLQEDMDSCIASMNEIKKIFEELEE